MPLQYDTPTTPEEVINAMASNPSISEETRQQIENILGISSGIAAPVNVGTFDGSTLTGPAGPIDMLIITPPAPSVPGAMVDIQIPEAVLQQAQAYVFQTSENINVVFNTVERVIVSGSGNDKMTVNGDKNTTLDGSGGNDTLVTSGGNDSVSGGDGNDSISAATGNDTIVSGLGSDTIDGGAGRDTVKFAGNKSDFNIQLVNGELYIDSKTDQTATSHISNVEFVEFKNGESVAVAAGVDEATVLRLYQGLLGRDPDKEGADYWVNILDTHATSTTGIANEFLASTEFNAKGSLNNEQFVVDALSAGP